MKVLVKFCVDADIIECPNHIVSDLEEYQHRFTEWLYDKNNDHSYWMYVDGEKYGCSYRAEAFVEWLNTFILNSNQDKAKVLEQSISEDGMICRTEYPKEITSTIHMKIEHFRKWLTDKNDEGLSKEEEYQRKYGMRKYIGYASTDWINEFILKDKDEKAYVVDKQIDSKQMQEMATICF